MLFKDDYLLEKAYLSVSQPQKSVPSDENEFEDDSYGDDSQMKDELIGDENMQPEGAITEDPELSHDPASECSCEDELEEDSMAVDNLNSIRESSMKIAMFWQMGGHLEPWQQQKLAICMNSLAEIARSLRLEQN